MKPMVEKLTLSEGTSFVARTYRTPLFEVPWHQHIEFELILFLEGEGIGFIGNATMPFEPGDIFFLGANLPHTFQKARPDLITSAVVVQFREDFWGKAFVELPESKLIRDLFGISAQGLKLQGSLPAILGPMIAELEHLQGFSRVVRLAQCLEQIALTKEYLPVATGTWQTGNGKQQVRIDSVIQFTMKNFHDEVTLAAVAQVANMSIPAFCHYFKKVTKKTYIDFLNEIRIGYACQLLMDTDQSVLNICYKSGFNTLANFNKQFLKGKQMPPSSFRKEFTRRKEYGFEAMHSTTTRSLTDRDAV